MTCCGYIAIIGAPNAGKSTLLNRMVGSKIAITTPKVQTTRQRILGITIHQQAQLIFMDTPGIFHAKKTFEKAMVSAAYAGVKEADVTLLMVDAVKGFCDNTQRILKELESGKKEIILVLNKVDKVKKESLPPLTEQLFAASNFSKCFMISALKGDGTNDILDDLAGRMPEGPWLYPEDQMTDMPMRMLAAEITREKLFMQLQQELPYQTFVETEAWEEKKDGSVRIQQVIYVRSENQKMIVLGKSGSMLKKIGEKSRETLARMLERKVHLFLFVKVKANWKENKEFYESLGLEFKQ